MAETKTDFPAVVSMQGFHREIDGVVGFCVLTWFQQMEIGILTSSRKSVAYGLVGGHCKSVASARPISVEVGLNKVLDYSCSLMGLKVPEILVGTGDLTSLTERGLGTLS